MIGQHGNEQTTRTGDAGGTATALTVCCALAVHRGRLEANHSAHLEPITELSLMRSTPKVIGSEKESDPPEVKQ
jgi:hypothetical protein